MMATQNLSYTFLFTLKSTLCVVGAADTEAGGEGAAAGGDE
jgi:hypothetical protein